MGIPPRRQRQTNRETCDRKKIRFTYLWDGDSIAEIGNTAMMNCTAYGTWCLTALTDKPAVQPGTAAASVRGPAVVTRTNHAVSDLTGRPLMLFKVKVKPSGDRGRPACGGWHSAARRHRLPGPARGTGPGSRPGLLYAGQWRDAESGLCYNRFGITSRRAGCTW